MSALLNTIPFSQVLFINLFIDLTIAIGLLIFIRWLAGKLVDVDTHEELCERDNNAFGISLAGRMFALCLVLSGAVGRGEYTDYTQTGIYLVTYGLLGILLIKVGRFAHDKLVLNRLDKDQHIQQRNTSVALVDASSAVATAIIIRSILLWAEGNDINAIVAILSGFAVTQAILLATTRIYERRFATENQSGTLQKALTKGQLALAVQHSGHLLGIALAVSAASNIIIYQPQAYVSNLTSWLILGSAITLFLIVFVAVSKRLIFSGTNLSKEIGQQHNLGVATIELVLSVGIALIFFGVLSHIG